MTRSSLLTCSRLGIQDSPSPGKQLFVLIHKLSLELEGLPARLKASPDVSICNLTF